MLYCLFLFASPIAREISQRFKKRDLSGVYGSREYWEGVGNRALEPAQNYPGYNPQDGKWYDENGLEDCEFEFDVDHVSVDGLTVNPKKKDVGLICHEPGCKADQFSRPYDLTRHMKSVHNKVLIYCEAGCEDKTFSRNDARIRHYRVAHPERTDLVPKKRRSKNDE